MSIILDALRRADAERERSRGGVPGVHDQAVLPAPLPSRDDPLPREPGGSRGWLIGALAVLLVTGAAWWLRQLQTRPEPLPASADPTPAASAQAAVPLPVAPPVTPAATPPVAPVATVAPAPISPPVAVPAPRPQASPAPAPAPAPRPASGPVVADAGKRVPRLQELPGALRAELPTLKLGGAMVSDSPGGSLLVVNDQLLHEGDTVAPGLLLEQIGRRSARLRWKGQAFEVAY